MKKPLIGPAAMPVMKVVITASALILAMVIIVMMQAGCAYINPKPGTIAEYFPVKPNSYYEYTGKGSDFASQKTFIMHTSENRAQRITEAGGYNATEIMEISNGELKYIGGNGVFCYTNITDIEADGHALILREPLEKGTIWQRDLDTVSEITSSSAKIETSMGKYTALEVFSTVARPATDDREAYSYTMKEYYVKGIGLVKSETYTGNQNTPSITQELTKVTENTSVQYYISMFYPKDGDVQREDHILTVTTNMDFIGWLENEMKNPEGDGLNPLLTASTKINSLVYDESAEVVKLDLSGDFIKEIEPELEERTLIGITDTLGKLYNVLYAEVTIDGEVYDSGRITLEAGVYFQIDRFE